MTLNVHLFIMIMQKKNTLTDFDLENSTCSEKKPIADLKKDDRDTKNASLD